MSFTSYWKEQLEEFEGRVDFWIPGLVVLLATVAAAMAGPLIPAPLVAIGLISLVRTGMQWGIINKPRTKDYVILGIATLLVIIGALILIGYSFVTVPLWKILIAAIIADVLAYLIGWVEWHGYIFGKPVGTVIGIIGSIFIFFVASVVVGGGIPGLIVGGIAAAGSMIPGPWPLTTVIVFGIYFAVSYVESWWQGIRFF